MDEYVTGIAQHASTRCLILPTSMADRPLAVFGDGNIAGSNFTNVGNRTIYNIYPPESKVASRNAQNPCPDLS